MYIQCKKLILNELVKFLYERDFTFIKNLDKNSNKFKIFQMHSCAYGSTELQNNRLWYRNLEYVSNTRLELTLCTISKFAR